MVDNLELINRVDQIAEKLQRAARGSFRPFGIEGHRFHQNPPLAVEALAILEAKHNITFPREYSTFITRFANGGAGPAYGLISLNDALRVVEDFGGTDFLRTPFQHTEAINPAELPEVVALSERLAKGDLLSDAEIADLENPAWYDATGTVTVCEIGCGMIHFLVVTGPTRGEMWMDGRRGFQPLRVGFLDWYEHWLDHVLAGGNGVWWED